MFDLMFTVFVFNIIFICCVANFLSSQIDWLPYGIDPAIMVPRTLYMGTIACHDIVEPYMPMRCLRQLGRQQCIPVPPIQPESASRPAKGPYKVEHAAGALLSSWTSFPHVNSLTLDRYARNTPPNLYAVSGDYMTWFLRVSHPRLLQSPETGPTIAEMPPVTATEEVLFFLFIYFIRFFVIFIFC